jgi:hypothetical protein
LNQPDFNLQKRAKPVFVPESTAFRTWRAAAKPALPRSIDIVSLIAYVLRYQDKQSYPCSIIPSTPAGAISKRRHDAIFVVFPLLEELSSFTAWRSADE